MLRRVALFALVTLAASAPVRTGSFTDAVTLSPEEWSASTASASAEPTVTSMQSQMDKQGSGLEAQLEIETLKGKQAELGAQLSELMREKEIDVRGARQLTSDEPTASIHQLARDSTTSDSLSKPSKEEPLHAASWQDVVNWGEKEADDAERYFHDVIDPDAMNSPPPPSAPEGHTYFRNDPGAGDTLRPNQVLMPGDQLRAVAHAPLGLPDFPLSEWMTKLTLLSSTSPMTFVAEFGVDRIFRFFAEKSDNESILLAEAFSIEETTSDPNMTDAVWTHKAKPEYYDIERLVELTGQPTYWAAAGQTQQTRPMNGHSKFLDSRNDVNAATMLPCGTFVFHTEGEDGAPPSAAALTERLANKWVINESSYEKWAQYNAFINTTRLPVSLTYWAFENITSLGCTLAKFILLQRVNEVQFPRAHGEFTKFIHLIPWNWLGPRLENAEWWQQCQLGIEEPCGQYFTPLNETYQRPNGQCIFALEGCPCLQAVFTGSDYSGRQLAPSQCRSSAPYCEKISNPQVNRGFGLLCSSTESEEYKEDHSIWHYVVHEVIEPIANLAMITASLITPGGEVVVAGELAEDMESAGEVESIFDSGDGEGSNDAINEATDSDDDDDDDASDDECCAQKAHKQGMVAKACFCISNKDDAQWIVDRARRKINLEIVNLASDVNWDVIPPTNSLEEEYIPPVEESVFEAQGAFEQEEPTLVDEWRKQILAEPTLPDDDNDGFATNGLIGQIRQGIADTLPMAWKAGTKEQRIAIVEAGSGRSPAFNLNPNSGKFQSNSKQLNSVFEVILGTAA